MQTLGKNRALAVIASFLIIVASLEVYSFVKLENNKKARLENEQKNRKNKDRGTPVLWRDPGHLRKKDLYYGPGSKALAPVPPFRFIKEDKDGKSPKFDVVDARGVKWKVKLGPEAQAETVATRLVWAAGYNAEESYYLPRARVEGLKKLSRGQKFVQGQSVVGARFEPRRENVERGKRWDWNKNPFKNTRELNGLKTMMVMLNNWDLRKNNTVLHTRNPKTGRTEALYTVSDLGATLGAVGAIGGRHRSKNNVEDFQRSRLVKKLDNKGNVKFDYDIKPKGLGYLTIFHPKYFFGQRKASNTISKVPVSDAAWIGQRLAQLSDEQLRDAFRAAEYDARTREAYVRSMRRRIDQLASLSEAGIARTRQRRAR
jgi:hypothetical protein